MTASKDAPPRPVRHCKYCAIEIQGLRKITCVECAFKRVAENNRRARMKRGLGTNPATQGRVSREELFDIFKENGMLERLT